MVKRPLEKLSSTALSGNFNPHVHTGTLRSKFPCRLVYGGFSRGLKLSFINEGGGKISGAGFEKILNKATKVLRAQIKKLLKNQSGEVCLVITKDKYIKILNQIYRGIDKSTDVLSFAYLEGEKTVSGDKFIVVGDIFISIETAKKQAKEKKHTLTSELEILFTHGILHLLGFDHKNDKQEKEMEKFAKKILV